MKKMDLEEEYKKAEDVYNSPEQGNPYIFKEAYDILNNAYCEMKQRYQAIRKGSATWQSKSFKQQALIWKAIKALEEGDSKEEVVRFLREGDHKISYGK